MIRSFIRISLSDQPPPSLQSSSRSINDLPDSVLVDIICRLLDHKVVFQCKLVSKRWCTLLSDPGCVSHFVRIQLDLQKPIINRYVMIIDSYANRKTLVLTMPSSEPSPPLETTQSSISSALPCLESHSYADQGHHLTVEGTYKDLVLCSQGTDSRLIYYICNFYTNKCIRLSPPTPRTCPPRHGGGITTGFICEPYYKEECVSNNRSIIKLHAEYRFRVVRLIITFDVSDKYEFEVAWRCFVEMFSSETGKWRGFSLSRRLVYQQEDFLAYGRRVLGRGVACNGKLYWLVHGGSIFEFDPFSLSSTSDDDLIDKCRFIDLPTDAYIHHTENFHIGVCRGRLQICPNLFKDLSYDFIVWELKENEEDDKLPEWCLLHRVTSHQLSEMVPNPLFTISILRPFRVAGFHPDHGDIVYLQPADGLSGINYIVVCNVREKTIQIATEFPSESIGGQFFSYVIPLWPTPVPSRLHFQEYLNITVIVAGVGIFTLKVDSLTTVKQLIKELQGKKVVYKQYVHELRFDGRVLDPDDDKWLTEYGIKDNSRIVLTRVYYDSSSRCSLQFSNN